MDAESWFREPEPVAWPMAVVGAIAGLFAASLAHSIHWSLGGSCLDGLLNLFPRRAGSVWDSALAAAGAALAFGLLGRAAAALLRRGERPGWLVVVGCVVAGQVAVVAPAIHSGRLGDWVIHGLVAGVVCMPAALLLTRTAARAWLTRAASVLHRGYRRAMWLDIATWVVVLLALYARPLFEIGRESLGRTEVARAFVGLAALGALAVATLTLDSLRLIGRLGAMRWERGADDEALASAAVTEDMGVGEQLEKSVRRGAQPYRDRGEVVALLRGDVARARSALWAALGRALCVALVGAAVVLAGSTGGFDPMSGIDSPFCHD